MTGNQMRIANDGAILDNVEMAIRRLQAFEPKEGYYVAFSGGKDSQCVYHLCKMAGVKFDAHYAITSVDPPELVKFIRTHYPDVEMKAQHYNDRVPEHYYADGRPKPITMWSLIADHTLPPTRKARYCCASLKEPGGEGRFVVTGVRWAESPRRRKTHDVVNIQGRQKSTKKLADEIGVDYRENLHGDIIMNDDNDKARLMVETCLRTQKRMLNPIVDWTDEEVWEFLNSNGIEHCCLYDEGFKRLGCIGCPLSGSKNMERDFERWPKYKQTYIRAFQAMIDNHPGEIKILDPNAQTKFKLELDSTGGVWNGFEIGSNSADTDGHDDASRINHGGGRANLPILPQELQLTTGAERTSGQRTRRSDGSQPANSDGGGTSLAKQCSEDGSKSPCAEFLFTDWSTHDGAWSPVVRTKIGNGSFKPVKQNTAMVVFDHWIEMGAL